MSIIFYGALVSPTSLTSYLALPHAVISVTRKTGTIEWIEEDVPASQLQDILAMHGHPNIAKLHGWIQFIQLKTGEFLMPGFIDTHTVSELY